MDQFTETINQGLYILIPSELGKIFYTIDCKIFKYLVKNICILQLFFNGLFYALNWIFSYEIKVV